MAIIIRPYTSEDQHAVAGFNRRLSEGGITSQFPECCVPRWLPKVGRRTIYQEYFLAVDDTGVVRGGYILKHQQFFLNGRTRSIGTYQLPISEGVVDLAYNLVALQLLTHALGRQPLLCGLGMGGLDQTLPRFLAAMKWALCPVPFYFRVLSPAKFLRNINVLRRSRICATALDLLAFSGVGWVVVRLYHALLARPISPAAEYMSDPVPAFGTWVDDVWERGRSVYCLTAVRDHEALAILYPENDKRFIRLRVRDHGGTVGWAVVLNTDMVKHKHFGNMQLGSIVDCFALPGKEMLVIASAARHLQTLGADLIVSNQWYASWCRALQRSGFVRGPSNFILAISPELTKMVGPLRGAQTNMHFNRGDGDGPIHL